MSTSRNYINRFGLGLLFLLFFIACNKDDVTTEPNPSNINYKQEMRNLVQEISIYAKELNPNFVIIPQNGVALVSTTGDDTSSPDFNYLNAIDGIGQEDLFYGYTADDQATPNAENAWIRSFLDMAKNNAAVSILVTDYCSTHANMDNSYAMNNAHGYISFAADHRELDNIPIYPPQIYNQNDDLITQLPQIQNFLYLINPAQFSSQQALVDAVSNTNYDLIIMDYFYNDEPYTATQIQQLKQKANGGKRLLISYMSIGEAEDYRYYWQSNWTIGNPAFIVQENPNWEGNYVVKYWEEAWQQIIFGNENSYLNKIISSGFDGVYLDVIEAFEVFEE